MASRNGRYSISRASPVSLSIIPEVLNVWQRVKIETR